MSLVEGDLRTNCRQRPRLSTLLRVGRRFTRSAHIPETDISQPGLRTDGHNIFLYHHPTQPGAPILCDFGVEVTRTFETAGEVYATETPGGEAAVAVHRGPYNRMNEAHNGIGKWMAANRRESAGHSWEIYGDPTPNPADTETTVVYLLK